MTSTSNDEGVLNISWSNKLSRGRYPTDFSEGLSFYPRIRICDPRPNTGEVLRRAGSCMTQYPPWLDGGRRDMRNCLLLTT